MKNKKNKQLIWKIVVWSISLILIFGLIIGFGINWQNPKWIFIAGSSTIQPFMQDISKNYTNAELSVNSGGSSYGIKSVVDNKKNIGMSAKMPDVSVAGLPNGTIGEFKTAWETDGIKTITFGKDAIGIIYKCNDSLSINDDNIINLYKAFCGVDITFNQLNQQSTTKKKILPFARAGGARESGTAEAFIANNNLKNGSHDNLAKINVNNSNILQILQTGDYGENVKQTNESNLETWQVIKNYTGNDIPMTYLGAGFISSNYDEIIANGFRVANYVDQTLLIENNNKINLNTDYGWYRPLNLIMKTKTDQFDLMPMKKFVQWLIGNSFFMNSNVVNIYRQIGFMIPNADTLKTMFNVEDNIINELVQFSQQNPNKNYDDFLKTNSIYINSNGEWNNFWIDDYNLYTLQKNERDLSKIYYGAIFK